jgi:competence protein ComEC
MSDDTIYAMKSLKEKAEVFIHDYAKATLFLFFTVVLSGVFYFLLLVVAPKKLQVTFFNVGQGDAIFIETPSGKQMLIDGSASNIILDRLGEEMSYFDRTLDVVIATHGDADHVTGLIPVLSQYTVSTIVVSPVISSSGIFDELQNEIDKEADLGAKVHVAKKGDVIDFGDGVVARVLYPRKNISQKTDTNDASVSAVISYGEHSFLLTGDLSASYESLLIDASLPKRVTVYKAGHHGSKTSSGALLLSRTQPEYVVISAGKDNKYGHPHAETVERLKKYSKEILSTIDKGTVTFLTNGRMLEVKVQN